MAVSLLTLLVEETKTKLYDTAIAIAKTVGLPTTTWQAGDPTRSTYHFLAEVLSVLEKTASQYIKSGFLDHAEGDWLKILAKQVYNVDATEATYASTSVVLTNTGGGLYVIAAGDLTFKNTVTGKTYRNTTGGTLASGPGTTLTVTVVADEAGVAGGALIGEIGQLVTVLLGVTSTNAAAAIGVDAESKEAIRARCKLKLAALSPNGPKDAYAFVALNSTLTGTTGITRARVFPDSSDGDVTVYLAGPSGAISSADRQKAEDAIAKWATPLTITPTVFSAADLSVLVTYSLWLYKSVNKTDAEVKTAVETALNNMFAARPIGGDIVAPALTGQIYKSLIESTIKEAFPGFVFRISVSAPSGDTAVANSQVAKMITPTGTITFEADP